jgi:hypothetical protein
VKRDHDWGFFQWFATGFLFWWLRCRPAAS